MLGEENDLTVLDLARAAGIRWVRIYLSWRSIEPENTSPAHFDWSLADHRLLTLTEMGFIPMVTITGNPSWAATKGDGPIDKPNGLAEFREFVVALVERYDADGIDDAPGSPRVIYWEFYNEPDAPERWAGHGADYAAMLKEVWPAVHGANPEAKVVFGGLAYEWWYGCVPCFDREFLSTVVANANGPNYPYFDIINYHYYDRLRHKWSPPNIAGKAKFLIEDQLPPDLRNLPIMCTELGEPYEGEPQVPLYSHELSARYVVQGFTHLLASQRWDVGPILVGTWFTMKYFEDGPRRFGLLSPDLQPLDEYWAYQAVSRELENARYLGALDRAGIEGYRFDTPSGETFVVWATDEPVDVSFTGARVRVVRKSFVDGQWRWPSRELVDGGPEDQDGSVNGAVTIEVDANPVFVQAVLDVSAYVNAR